MLISLLLALFVISLVVGCGKTEQTPADDMAAGAPEEVKDTTRLDSVANEMKEKVDSVAQEGADAAKQAVDKAAEQVGGK
jgi:hypothetical protein